MNTTCEIHEVATDKGQPVRASNRPVLRVAFVLVVFAMCCYVAFHVGAFIAASRGAGRRASEPAEAAQLDPLAAMPFAGQWAFDELDWSLKSQTIDARELAAEFASQSALPPSASDADLPEADAEIIGLITALQIHPTETMGNQVYRIDRPDLKIQLIARDVGGEAKAVAFAMAFPQDDKWQLFAFTPRQTAAVAATTMPAASHLLPLPSDACRSGGRFDDVGRPLLEFISLDASADTLLDAWKEAGWEVRPSELAAAADFSYLCARGDETVYAWSTDPPEALKNLMLVRTPAPADTSP